VGRGFVATPARPLTVPEQDGGWGEPKEILYRVDAGDLDRWHHC